MRPSSSSADRSVWDALSLVSYDGTLDTILDQSTTPADSPFSPSRISTHRHPAALSDYMDYMDLSADCEACLYYSGTGYFCLCREWPRIFTVLSEYNDASLLLWIISSERLPRLSTVTVLLASYAVIRPLYFYFWRTRRISVWTRGRVTAGRESCHGRGVCGRIVTSLSIAGELSRADSDVTLLDRRVEPRPSHWQLADSDVTLHSRRVESRG